MKLKSHSKETKDGDTEMESPSKSKAIRSVTKKTSPDKKPAAEKEKVTENNFKQRFYTTGSIDGTSFAYGKLPQQENREPYIWHFWEFIMGNEAYKEKLCIDNIVPLRDPNDEDESLLNGRDDRSNSTNIYQPYWQGVVYTHIDSTTNTVAWRKVWGENIVKMLNYHILNSTKFTWKNEFEYRGEETRPSPIYLGALLSTKEVFKIMDNSYSSTSMEVLLEDDDVITQYFGSDRVESVRMHWHRLHRHYPGANGGEQGGQVALVRYFDEEMSRLPRLDG
jgi:hypothetical protein